MSNIERFGISLPKDLLEKFDKIILRKGYSCRSEAIRDLMRDNIIEHSIAENKEVVGTLTIIYNHHTRDLSDKLTDIQHCFHNQILATTHVHLDRHNCAEVIILKGKSGSVKQVADKLISAKGVKHGKLVMSTTKGG
ncbi:MAG: nickel-responsive transcriptional regulator NikR [Candidatus Saganbacteria bacterium]|nr:nickel-responsive transcriptional regulator NikR [Candidatus Saganbacteria bacterium]